jgi:hypothetical protein
MRLGDDPAVNVTIRLIHDWRNDQPSSNRPVFIIDDDGAVVSMDIPEKRCV